MPKFGTPTPPGFGSFFVPKRHICNWDVFGGGPYMASNSSSVWSAAETAIFWPIPIECACSVTQFFIGNGAATSDNVDIGLYDRYGTLIASTGETAQSGTTTAQFIAPSGGTFSIGPDLYYLAAVSDDAAPITAAYRSMTLTNVQLGRAMGILQMASASPLPASATFATLTSTVVPLMGLVAQQIPNSYKPVAPACITPWNWTSVGGGVPQTALNVMNGTSSGTWPTANHARYYPIYIPAPMVLVQGFVLSGATWDGATPHHFDIGLYDVAGTRLIGGTGTNMNGTTNTLQLVDITDIEVGPGVYYLALAIDTNTDTVFRSTGGSMGIALGFGQQATAYPLPDPFTFATSTTNTLPVFGFTTQTVI